MFTVESLGIHKEQKFEDKNDSEIATVNTFLCIRLLYKIGILLFLLFCDPL